MELSNQQPFEANFRGKVFQIVPEYLNAQLQYRILDGSEYVFTLQFDPDFEWIILQEDISNPLSISDDLYNFMVASIESHRP